MNDYIRNVRKYVIDKTKAYTEEIDDYDFWNEHIKYVEYYAHELAERYHADKEIVQLGALLHDIALVEKIGTRKDHHIQGAVLAAGRAQSAGNLFHNRASSGKVIPDAFRFAGSDRYGYGCRPPCRIPFRRDGPRDSLQGPASRKGRGWFPGQRSPPDFAG